MRRNGRCPSSPRRVISTCASKAPSSSTPSRQQDRTWLARGVGHPITFAVSCAPVMDGTYEEFPLTPREQEELEDDLISFCDRELDLLGDIRGLEVLYAGGSAPLWIEGISQRIGEGGSLVAIDLDAERVDETQSSLGEAELAAPVRLLADDVFAMPFNPDTFDLVYSSGLFHELDVSEKGAEDALEALRSVALPGGRVVTADFVDSEPAVQLEDEELEAELRCAAYGSEVYGIGPPERLISLYQELFRDVRSQVSPPQEIRHLWKLVLAEEEPPALTSLPAEVALRWRERRRRLWERILNENYTRPATLYIE